MRVLRKIIFPATMLTILSGPAIVAQSQKSSTDVPTFRQTSNLVFLDVTVLDKKGHPVVTGLTKDDFVITEEKKPQRIFSFEAPEAHNIKTDAADLASPGKAPATIFVLDLLNSDFPDFAFIRYSVQKYLESQPDELETPAELLVVGNQSLEMLQGFTRNKGDLLFALNHLPAILPYKKMNGAFFAERFGQSIDALQQIALQSKGVPGRKNVIWVGHGGPNVSSMFLPTEVTEKLNRYVDDTANLLVDARVSLFVIYPGLKTELRKDVSLSAMTAQADLGESNPFSGDINFGVFVNLTGGTLFYNRNDVDREMAKSEELGSNYYTLTYQPHDVNPDGKFRRIRVALRDPKLHAVTKTGYFAPEKDAPTDPLQQTMVNLTDAAHSTIPYQALDLKIANVVRHPDARTAEVTVNLKGKNLDWLSDGDGKSDAVLTVAAVSLTGRRTILASKLTKLTVHASSQDVSKLAEASTPIKVTVRVPRKTESIRVVMETAEGGRIGSAELGRAQLNAASELPTPEPALVPKPKAPPTAPIS